MYFFQNSYFVVSWFHYILIKNEDLTKDDIEVLQDMIMIATNNAIKNVDQAMEKAMGQYGSALNGLF